MLGRKHEDAFAKMEPHVRERRVTAGKRQAEHGALGVFRAEGHPSPTRDPKLPELEELQVAIGDDTRLAGRDDIDEPGYAATLREMLHASGVDE
jgi:hypothetical protein